MYCKIYIKISDLRWFLIGSFKAHQKILMLSKAYNLFKDAIPQQCPGEIKEKNNLLEKICGYSFSLVN